uniref:Uncharacterized protein n=1 Tax=Tanacetum cinerariifolium TaxID=118510 RepID=A0A6L2KB87_TANCI|nr:hypothetical protein [Tanacetum cinerariifolium]
MSLNEFHKDENIRILAGRPIMVAAMADVSSSICCLPVYDDLLMFTAFFCDYAVITVFGKTERQDFYRPQCVTPPNGPWTEYVSGGVTLLSISSTKHKERPLRVSDQRPPNSIRHDIYPLVLGHLGLVSATHPDRDN